MGGFALMLEYLLSNRLCVGGGWGLGRRAYIGEDRLDDVEIRDLCTLEKRMTSI